MTKERIKWEQEGSYRNLRAEIDNFLLVIVGAGKYQFKWVVFHNGSELVSSDYPCRNVPEAQRTTEAIYHLAKQFV